jgi:hypothetical protein
MKNAKRKRRKSQKARRMLVIVRFVHVMMFGLRLMLLEHWLSVVKSELRIGATSQMKNLENGGLMNFTAHGRHASN